MRSRRCNIGNEIRVTGAAGSRQLLRLSKSRNGFFPQNLRKELDWLTP